MLPCIAILFPVLSGILISVMKKEEKMRNRLYAAAILLSDLLCVLEIRFRQSATPIAFTGTLKITFAPDSLGCYCLTAVMVLYTAVTFYAFEYMKKEERPSVFFAFLFISYGAFAGVCLSGNLVTLYLCFEMLTLTTVPLVLHELTKEAVAGGLKYLFYSVAGALMGLLAVFFLYQYAGGDTSFVKGGFLDLSGIAGHENLLRGVILAGIIGFGTKAGMYPMHGWLPAAHPVAPAPASSLLSGIVAKAGVLAVIRLVYYSAGTELLAGTWVQYTWMTLCLLTIFMGSMMAFREKVIKKRLAYSTISQISYILFGLSLMTERGVRGGLIHLMGHAASKGCLFLAAGVFIYQLGIHDVSGLKGIGKRMPVTMWCFTIVSLSLVGIPPLAGFLSKWEIASAAVGSGAGVFAILGPVVLLISALLTGGYLLTIVVDAFFPGREENGAAEPVYEKAEPPALMTVPMIVLAAASLVVGTAGLTLLNLYGL